VDPWPFIPKSTPGAFQHLLNQMHAIDKDLLAIPAANFPVEVIGHFSNILQRFLIIARAIDMDGSDACASPVLWDVFIRIVNILYHFFRRCNVALHTDLDINAIRPSIRSVQAMLDMINAEFATYVGIFVKADTVRHLNAVVQFIPISYRSNMHQLLQMVTRSNLVFFRDATINDNFNVAELNLQYLESARENRDLIHIQHQTVVSSMQTLKDMEPRVKNMCATLGSVDVSIYEFLSAQRMLDGIRTCRLSNMSTDLQLFTSYIRGPMAQLYKEGTYCIHFVYNLFTAVESQIYTGVMFQNHVKPWHIKSCLLMMRHLQKKYGYSQDVMEKIVSDCLLVKDVSPLMSHRSSVVFTVRPDPRNRPADPRDRPAT